MLGEPRKPAFYAVCLTIILVLITPFAPALDLEDTRADNPTLPGTAESDGVNLHLQTCSPCSFVIQHKCRHWETLTSVAVQYNVDVAAIRVLNNLMTDHSLRSRQAVYVPGMPLLNPLQASSSVPMSTSPKPAAALACITCQSASAALHRAMDLFVLGILSWPAMSLWLCLTAHCAQQLPLTLCMRSANGSHRGQDGAFLV